MSSDEQSEKECPLCMEVLEIDDVDFYPCKCEYQICRFCWHRLRTDENGLCPACRQPYPENPVNFKPLSASDVLKIKSEKKQKQQQQRIKISESRKHLSSYRVLQKNLVYVVGLSARVADPDILKKPDYFGKYGRILKVAVGTSTSANGSQSASCTAYVTYVKYEDALTAIQAVNNAQLDGRIVKASLGTTKYCSSFLRSQPCHKPECMYLHDVADDEVSFTKDDMHLGRHADYEKKLIETTLLRDKANRERMRVVANNIRRHSKSKSGERGTTVSHSNSAGASLSPEVKNREKVANSNPRQAERSGSAPHTQTVPLRDSAINDTDRMIVVNMVTNKEASSPERGEQLSQLTTKNKRLVKTKPPECGVNEDIEQMVPAKENHAPVIEQTQCTKVDNDDLNGSIPLGSRLVQWTTPERVSPEGTEVLSDQSDHVILNGHIDANSGESWSIDEPTETLVAKNDVEPPDWQRVLGFSLGDPQDNTVLSDSSVTPDTVRARSKRPSRPSLYSDDELGFDPFSESSKGLADLLEEERSRAPRLPPSSASMPSVTSVLPLGMQFGWPSAGTLNGTGYDCSPFGSHVVDKVTAPHSSSGPNLFPPSTLSPCDFFGSLSMTTAGQPSMQSNNPAAYYMNCQQQQQQQSYSTSIVPQSQQQRCSQLNGSSRTMLSSLSSYADPPPGLSSVYSQQRYSPFAALNNPSPPQPDAAQRNEWQEGLKALLPNVNVTFVSELNAAGYPTTRGHAPSTVQPPQQQQVQHCSQPTSMLNCYGQSSYSYPQPVPQWMPPPPGFSKR